VSFFCVAHAAITFPDYALSSVTKRLIAE
jgi:hypothetical protein